MARNQLDHGSTELSVVDLPASVVHNLEAFTARKEDR